MMNGVLDGRSEYIDMITPPMALCCGFLQHPFATEKQSSALLHTVSCLVVLAGANFNCMPIPASWL